MKSWPLKDPDLINLFYFSDVDAAPSSVAVILDSVKTLINLGDHDGAREVLDGCSTLDVSIAEAWCEYFNDTEKAGRILRNLDANVWDADDAQRLHDTWTRLIGRGPEYELIFAACDAWPEPTATIASMEPTVIKALLSAARDSVLSARERLVVAWLSHVHLEEDTACDCRAQAQRILSSLCHRRQGVASKLDLARLAHGRREWRLAKWLLLGIEPSVEVDLSTRIPDEYREIGAVWNALFGDRKQVDRLEARAMVEEIFNNMDGSKTLNDGAADEISAVLPVVWKALKNDSGVARYLLYALEKGVDLEYPCDYALIAWAWFRCFHDLRHVRRLLHTAVYRFLPETCLAAERRTLANYAFTSLTSGDVEAESSHWQETLQTVCDIETEVGESCADAGMPSYSF